MRNLTLIALILILSLAAVSIELAYEQFLILGNRGIVDKALEDISAFYGQTKLTWITFATYLVSGLLVWFVIAQTERIRGGRISVTGFIALFVSPGIFVDPSRAENVAILLSATDFETASTILPAWMSILLYSVKSPYFLYWPVAVLTTFWTIPLTWGVLFGLSIGIQFIRDSRWSRLPSQ